MAQDMLGKVRGLVETAESFEAQGNAEAAETYRTKAEELMKKYRIAEEELIAKDPASLSPTMVPIVVVGYIGNPFQQQYADLFDTVARHAEVRFHFDWENPDGTGYKIVAKTVGYETDVRYAEMLFTAARLVFSERLDPKVDSGSDQENVYRLRSAGMERVRVADAIWGDRSKANLSKVGRLYKAECKARGEVPALDGRGVTGKVYREQYANEFVWALARRLRRTQEAAGYGGSLTLHGRKERIDEAFYNMFPGYRPKPEIQQAEPTTPLDCEKCAKARKRTGDEDASCRDHKPYKPTKADMARHDRYYSAAAQRGREAGTNAANHVQLDRGYREGLES